MNSWSAEHVAEVRDLKDRKLDIEGQISREREREGEMLASMSISTSTRCNGMGQILINSTGERETNDARTQFIPDPPTLEPIESQGRISTTRIPTSSHQVGGHDRKSREGTSRKNIGSDEE